MQPIPELILNKSAVAGFRPITESNLWTALRVVSVMSSIITQFANRLQIHPLVYSSEKCWEYLK